MRKRFLALLIPISCAVIAKNLFIHSKQPTHTLVETSFINRTQHPGSHPQDDVTDCFLDSTIDNLKLKIQYRCGSKISTDVDDKLDSIICYSKDIDSNISERMEITHHIYIPTRPGMPALAYYLNQKIAKGYGKMDSISRVTVSGIEGVREEFENDLIENGARVYYKHLRYYLIHKDHIIIIDYSVGGKKENSFNTMLLYQKCEPIYENMIINTELHSI